VRVAFRLAFESAGSSIAARMAMIAITTSSSISVNAFLVFFIIETGLMLIIFHIRDGCAITSTVYVLPHPHTTYRFWKNRRCRLERDQFAEAGVTEELFEGQFGFMTPIGAFGGGAGNILRALFKPEVFKIDQHDF